MVALVINKFGGMMPRVGRQQLPEMLAQSAINCDLLSGEVRALHARGLVYDGRDDPTPIERAYRVVHNDLTADWVLFDDPTIDFVKGPLINDSHERYYWTSETDVPRYNTSDRIDLGDPALILGVPEPVNAPTVSSTGALLPVTRAYTYTFVTEFGEEGPPAPPTVADGFDEGTWTIGNMDTVPPAPWDTQALITEKFIYRTITGTLGNVEYHYVATVPIGDVSFDDSVPTLEVGLNRTIQSEFWFPPPKNLIGIVAHPNGFLIGFTAGRGDIGFTEDATPRDIYFSEPYRPHAWNPGNVLSTQHIIKGLGIFGTSTVVATAGNPYVVSGIRPEAMVLTEAETPEACVSNRRGVVAMAYGVLYPTSHGLMLVSPSGFSMITQKLISKEDWLALYSPSTFRAVRQQNQYMAFFNPTKGVIISGDEPMVAFTVIDGYWRNQSVQTDNLTGDVYTINDNVIYSWNPPRGVPVTAEWWSKEFDSAKPINFGAARIVFDLDYGQISEEELALYRDWNDARYAAGPLAPLNFAPICGVTRLNPGGSAWPPLSEDKNTYHSGPLINIGRALYFPDEPGANDFTIQATLKAPSLRSQLPTAVQLLVYANGTLVAIKDVLNTKPFRLPTGFKATRWSFRMRTTANILSFKVAETGEELAKV